MSPLNILVGRKKAEDSIMKESVQQSSSNRKQVKRRFSWMRPPNKWKCNEENLIFFVISLIILSFKCLSILLVSSGPTGDDAKVHAVCSIIHIIFFFNDF